MARDLPTGTLTFLFTDIEGSTQLVREMGDAYRAAIEDHHRLVRAAIAEQGGQQVRLEGDSFFVVFTSAVRGVAAAAAMQRTLFENTWDADHAIRVRIGLHTGEAALGGGDYVGLDVHRAARIASAAHGGQVLISESTRRLVEQNLPTGVSLRDLGEHRLKDLAAAEHLYQLVIPSVPNDFPSPRALDETPNNLPTQLTSFVGRSRELADAERRLGGTRLLTLTGPGGTGKTRLSLRLAAESADHFLDGVFFVALAPVGDPALVASTIAQSLGIQDTGGRSPRDRLIDHLREKSVLLVLDNFEQILPAAPLVGELLAAASGLKVIVTSRAPLRIYGEHELHVPPLGLPDPRALPADLQTLSQYEAVALFIERATAIKPDFRVTNENAPAIAEICVRLDGLPLAIELAAARIKLLPPEAMLRRLEHRLGWLGSGPRDVPARQQTLRGAIAWSYDMLDERSRRLFARLSVFVGGASLEETESVCGPADELGIDVLDGLSSLVDHSLLVQREELGEPRFSMLETIREFALERSQETGEATEIQRRHATTFLELAERAAPELTGADQARWLDTLEREHDNLRAAIDWAIATRSDDIAMRLSWALWHFWQMRGHLHEATRRTLQVVDLPNTEAHATARARAYEAAGSIAYWANDMASAQRHYEAALQFARELDDKALIANALYNLSFPYGFSLKPENVKIARSLQEESLALYRELDDITGVGKALWGIGTSEVAQGEWPDAQRTLEEALGIFRAAGDRFSTGWALHAVGTVAIRLGDLTKARGELEEAINLFAEARDVSGVSLLLDDMSELTAAEGDALQSIRLAGAAAAHQAASGTNLADANNRFFARTRPDEGSSPEAKAAWAEGQRMDLGEAVRCALTRSELPAATAGNTQ